MFNRGTGSAGYWTFFLFKLKIFEINYLFMGKILIFIEDEICNFFSVKISTNIFVMIIF